MGVAEPLICASARVDPSAHEEASRVGMNDFLEKPVRPARAIDLGARVCARYPPTFV
jgi:hypothetical protein